MLISSLPLAFFLACSSGSGSDVSFSNPDAVVDWAALAGAPGVMTLAYMPELLSMTIVDDDCPVVTTEGFNYTYEGGCTDSAGSTWTGSYDYSEAADAMTATMATVDFGSTGWSAEDCPGSTGSVTLNGLVELGYLANASLDYGTTVDVEIDVQTDWSEYPCAGEPPAGSAVASYSMTVEQSASGEVYLFNGSGTIDKDDEGIVEATTVDQLFDTCGQEADSGTLTMVGSETVVITYDGATDCDPESTVTWTLDGEDQGELSGVSCATGGGFAGSWLALFLPLIGVAVRRRQ